MPKETEEQKKIDRWIDTPYMYRELGQAKHTLPCMRGRGGARGCVHKKHEAQEDEQKSVNLRAV
jgi:hypothetical protein